MRKGLQFLLSVLVISALGFGAFTFLHGTSKNASQNYTQTKVSSEKIYTSATYKFSFAYPASYEIKEYSSTKVSVGKATTGGFDSVADVSLVKADPNTEEIFDEFVLDQARFSCSMEGPDTSTSCSRVVGLAPFISQSGASGEIFNLKAVTKTLKTGATTETDRGPYYTFNTSDQTSGTMSFVMITNPSSRTQKEASQSVLEVLAKSFTLHR